MRCLAQSAAEEGGSSKWLREENDSDWAGRYGKDNYKEDFSGFQNHSVVRSGNHGRMFRERDKGIATLQGGKQLGGMSILQGGSSNSISLIGPREEELDGLEIEERKRKRTRPVLTDNKDTE